MEHLDVVDEDGSVVDQVPRPEVHEEGLWHRAVHCFVFDPEGQLFLQRRSSDMDLYPDVWTSSASGHPRAGEGWKAAMQRELEEEIAVVAKLTEVGQFRYDGGLDREISRLYTATYDGPIELDDAEVQDGRWIELGELTDWMAQSPDDFAPSFHEAFAIYEDRAGPGPP